MALSCCGFYNCDEIDAEILEMWRSAVVAFITERRWDVVLSCCAFYNCDEIDEVLEMWRSAVVAFITEMRLVRRSLGCGAELLWIL